MGNIIDILFIYNDSFYLGSTYLDDDLKFNINDERGRPIKLDNIGKIWITENDDVHLISQDNLYSLLCPLRDQNGREVHIGDYIANIIFQNKTDFIGLSASSLIVYQVRSIDETTVGVKVIHDSRCPMLILARNDLASFWTVIPFKKN